MTNFSSKRTSEVEVFTVDFVNLLPPGVTVVSAVWSMGVHLGRDPAAASMLRGAYSIVGSEVRQMIGGGLAVVIYLPICTALLSDGQTKVLPDSGEGRLQITA